jgi:hypothetical protein
MLIRVLIYRISGILFLLVLLVPGGYSQNKVSQPVRLMFYNVENLFDVYKDTLKDDAEFLPGGVMRWNQTRYNKKINSLYKTIIAAGEWEPPAVVAFCEVENRKVLEDLIYGTYLSKFLYGIVHEESPDMRGIDVCLIYRKNLAKLINYEYCIPSGIIREKYATRSVLYAKFEISSDTIHLFVNHWPSRRGGVLAGEDLRMAISSMVRDKADSIMKINPKGAKIVFLGDFNCTPDDQEIKSMTAFHDSTFSLINLSESLAAKGLGTYRYMGSWELIDQVIVSGSLLEASGGIYTEAKLITIFKPEFLITKDPKYPGFSPYSTYRGYKYQGGYSDHLPVLLDLKVKMSDQQE